GQWIVATACRPELALELGAEHGVENRLAFVPGHAGPFGPMPEVREVQLEATARQQSYELPEVGDGIGPAGRRQAHHLEFVSVLRESQVLGDREVQEAKRVGEERPSDHLETRSAAGGPRRADEIAETIQCADRSLVKR